METNETRAGRWGWELGLGVWGRCEGGWRVIGIIHLELALALRKFQVIWKATDLWGGLLPLQGEQDFIKNYVAPCGLPSEHMAQGRDFLRGTMLCSWGQQHPVHRHLNIYLLLLTPLWKLNRIVTLSPKYEKKTEDQRGGQFAIDPTAGQGGLRPATHRDPHGCLERSWAEWRAAWRYADLIPGHYLREWLGCAGCWCFLQREGSAKGAATPVEVIQPGVGTVSRSLVAALAPQQLLPNPAATATPLFSKFIHSFNTQWAQMQ